MSYLSIVVGFTIFVMVLLLVYMGYRLFLRKKLFILASFGCQIIAITIGVLSFTGNVQTENYVEAFYLVFGITIPGVFFLYDYTKMMKKIKEQGVYQGFVEPAPKEDGIIDISLTKKHINPIIKERQVPELIKDLNLNKDEILKNIKKSLTQAQTFINSKDYNNAFEIYNTLVKLVKNCPSLYYNHGNICYNKNDFTGALQSYKKAIEIDENLIKEISGPKEVFSIVKSKKDSSSEIYTNPKTKADIQYEEFMVYFNIGNAQFKLNKFQQAIDNYKKALEKNPSMDEADENIARAMIAMERIDEAIEYYLRKVDKDRANYKVHYILGTLYSEIRKYGESLESLSECLRLNSNCLEALEETGKVLSKTGRYKEAIVPFKKLVKLNPEDFRGHYNLGTSLYHAGTKQAAVQSFKKVLDTKPDHFKALYNMAVAFDELGNQEDAISAFKKVIDIKVDFIDAYNNLGIILSTQGRLHEALEIYIKGLKKNPDEYSLYYNMGITLSEMGRYEDAVEAYKNALEIKPDEHEISYHLGSALTELKKYNEAIEAYKNAIKIKPSDSELFYNLATVYSIIKKHDIAMDNLRKAIELNNDLKEDARHNMAFNNLKTKAEFKELVL
jgi:tetratricopeptide (TPR) repeat protein